MQEEGEQVRVVIAETYLARGQHESARDILCEARDRLHAVAARIQDPGIRTRFFSNVPANRHILARCPQGASV